MCLECLKSLHEKIFSRKCTYCRRYLTRLETQTSILDIIFYNKLYSLNVHGKINENVKNCCAIIGNIFVFTGNVFLTSIRFQLKANS